MPRLAQRQVPCKLEAFDQLRDAVLGADADDGLKRKMCLACEEAFVNVVSYSGASSVWFTVSEAEGGLIVTLADDGAAFDPTSSAPVEKEFEELDTGGMGINLVRELATTLSYRREAGLNKLSIFM